MIAIARVSGYRKRRGPAPGAAGRQAGDASGGTAAVRGAAAAGPGARAGQARWGRAGLRERPPRYSGGAGGRRREERVCARPGCEARFWAVPSDPKAYCSRSCAASVNNARRRLSPETRARIREAVNAAHAAAGRKRRCAVEGCGRWAVNYRSRFCEEHGRLRALAASGLGDRLYYPGQGIKRSASTVAKGVSAELMTAARLLALGVEVYRPLSPDGKCDLLAVYQGRYTRVQCKVAWRRKACFVTDNRKNIPRRNGSRKYQYSKQDIDIVVVYCPNDVFYVIPVEEFSRSKSYVTLRPDQGSRSGSRSQRAHHLERFREAWYLIGCVDSPSRS